MRLPGWPAPPAGGLALGSSAGSAGRLEALHGAGIWLQ